MKRSSCSKMSYENHITQDHCYLDDSGTEEITIKDSILTSTEGQKYKSPQYIVVPKKHNDYNYLGNTFVPNVVYLPAIEYCTEHSDLFLHEDEKLVKPGDKFDSHKDFIQYLNENAKRWYFYYKCSDSRKPNTEHETYIYTCVYLGNKEKYIKKGMRKRTSNIKTNCPCKIKLKHLPNERQLTVVFVCNHHDHPLSEQEFYKLQHGRRLPPYIKEEIMDFISLHVEMDKIKKYVQMQTGFSMNRTFFYQIERTMRLRNIERHLSNERLLELSLKINKVDQSCFDENSVKGKNVQDDLENVNIHTNLPDGTDSIRYLNVQNIKQRPVKKCLKRLKTTKDNKVYNLNQNSIDDNLNMQNVFIVQEPLNCETQNDTWVVDQCVSVLPSRTFFNNSDSETTKYKDLIDISAPENRAIESNMYYSVNGNDQEHILSEVNETIDNDLHDNCVAYETIVTDTVEDNHTQVVDNVNNETTDETKHVEVTKDNHENVIDENREIIEHASHKELTEFLPDNNLEFCGYVHFNNESNENLHDCNNINGSNDDEGNIESNLDNSTTCDVDLHNNSDDIKTTRYPLIPVFDVYMKDGNVTGFVVNDNILNNLKQVGIEKGVQTNETNECITQTASMFENNSQIEPKEPEGYIERTSQNTYQRHEYIHKYNIDQYMMQPHFPNYIRMLSQQIHVETLHMIKNIYNEKAMFKMTTTQRDKHGDTRIWYLTIRFE